MSLDYVFQTETRIYFLMKYIEGGDLFRHLAKKGKFKEKAARFYAAQVMVALGYLHKKRIIYRDLKLENILLDRDGYILISDFGLSKIIGPQETSLDPFGTLVRRRAILTIIELCGSRGASVEALRQRSRPMESGCDNLPATQSRVAVRRRRRPRDRQIDHI